MCGMLDSIVTGLFLHPGGARPIGNLPAGLEHLQGVAQHHAALLGEVAGAADGRMRAGRLDDHKGGVCWTGRR
jgi:hypothetical protein